jgi:competence protein ComEA
MKKVPRELIYASIVVISVTVVGLVNLARNGKLEDIWTLTPTESNEPTQPNDSLDSSNSSEPGKANNPTEDIAQVPQETISVYITGAVVNPGVYDLAPNARVKDALDMAGGATEQADLLRINLASRISDGQQIIVPKLGELIEAPTEDAGIYQNSDDGLINVNTADIARLMELPGIGEVIASNIIAYREANGLFKDIEELKNVNRIGDKTFERLKDLITIGGT